VSHCVRLFAELKATQTFFAKLCIIREVLSLFMLGATYGHIREVIIARFVAIWLAVLLFLHYQQGGFGKELPRSP
jgi:hypothetical protein